MRHCLRVGLLVRSRNLIRCVSEHKHKFCTGNKLTANFTLTSCCSDLVTTNFDQLNPNLNAVTWLNSLSILQFLYTHEESDFFLLNRIFPHV